MKKILFTLICLQGIFAFGQTPIIEWQKSLGGAGVDQAYSIQQTTDGGYIVAGRSSSNNGDVTGNHGNHDYWVVKLNASGNITWQKSLGGTSFDYAYSVQQTTDGGYIVAGHSFSSNGDITGVGAYWIVKLNASGNITWQKSLGGSTGYDYAHSIQQTTDGGYIVAGRSKSNNGDVSGNHGEFDYWVVKLNASGNIMWQKSLGGTGDDYAYSIQQTTDGGYVMAGYSRSNDGDVTGNQGGADYWVVKLNTTGNITWQKSLGGTGNDFAYSIHQTTDGGYIVAGESNSTDGDVTGNHGGYDSWIVKLNSLGNIMWQKSLGGTGGEDAQSIRQTTDGGYIVAGYSDSNNGDLTGNFGGYDYWVVKLNASGNITWQKSLGGTGNERSQAIQQTSDGGYIVAGSSISTDGDVTGNHGGSDYWIVKLKECYPVAHSISETACASFTWTSGNGNTYTSSTTATHTIVGGATNGCDSIVTLNLTINQPTSSSVAVSECGSYTWAVNNQTYTSSGSYTHVVPNANNCDSTITLNLTIYQSTSFSVTVSECEEYIWAVNNQTYTSSGSYTHVIPNTNNCDSTITLNLTINQPTSSSVSVTECGSYTWPVNNQTYTSTGSYTHVVPNANNCDSTITLNLTINNVDNTVSVSGITLTANQAGANYQWVDCDNGNASIPGETAQSFEPTANGNYAVEVTANGCTETSNCVVVNSVGIDEIWYAELVEVYPNPNNGVFTISSTQTLNNAVVEVYSALGQLVYSSVHSGNKVVIDLEEQPTGVYVLKVNNQQNFRIVKL